MKIKKIVSLILALCASFCVFATPFSAVSPTGSGNASYTQNENKPKNVTSQHPPLSLLEEFELFIGKIFITIGASVAIHYTVNLSVNTISDLYNKKPVTKNEFSKAYNDLCNDIPDILNTVKTWVSARMRDR